MGSAPPMLHTGMVSAALIMGREQRLLGPAAIFHSDRGTQYKSEAFQDQCAGLGVIQSMGATGVCWDNAVAESFFATLTCDLVAEIGAFATRQDARAWTVRYFDTLKAGAIGGVPTASTTGARRWLLGASSSSKTLSHLLDTHQHASFQWIANTSLWLDRDQPIRNALQAKAIGPVNHLLTMRSRHILCCTRPKAICTHLTGSRHRPWLRSCLCRGGSA
jgi:transposase InsO family protein